KGGAASAAHDPTRGTTGIGGNQRQRQLMTDAAIRLADHIEHAGLDEASGVFEPARVEFSGNLDRLTPQVDAAAKRPCQMEPVPGREHTPAAGRVCDRYYGGSGEPGGINYSDAGRHCRSARAI